VTAHRARRPSPKPGKRWTKREILAQGARTDLPIAGSIIAGLSETSSRELWRAGKFPVPVLQVGRRLVVPMQPILDLLGISDGGSGNRSHAPGQEPGGRDEQRGLVTGGDGAPAA
jgi:hypothetical protein